MKAKYILLIVLMLAGISAYAVPSTYMCSLHSNYGALDKILGQYYNVTFAWKSTILPRVREIFWWLFSLEFIYQVVVKKILAGDYQKLYVFFITRVFIAYIFAYIFLDPDFYNIIIKYFINLGAMAGGITVDLGSNNPFAGFSPSAILSTGDCLWNQVYNTLSRLPTLTEAAYVLPLVFITILVYILLAVMALALMLTALEAYVVLFGGFILAGFSGSSWTQNYWQKYLSYVGGVAIRLFVTCLILGVIRDITAKNIQTIATMSSLDISPIIGTLLLVLITTFINALLVLTVPAKAASMLSGTINSSLGEMISTASAAFSGAMGAGALMGGAGNLAGGVLKAPSVGTKAAMGAAKSILAGGATGGGSGSASAEDWKKAAASIGKDKGKEHMKSVWADTKGQLKTGAGNMADSVKQASNVSSGHSGASEVNANPHSE